MLNCRKHRVLRPRIILYYVWFQPGSEDRGQGGPWARRFAGARECLENERWSRWRVTQSKLAGPSTSQHSGFQASRSVHSASISSHIPHAPTRVHDCASEADRTQDLIRGQPSVTRKAESSPSKLRRPIVLRKVKSSPRHSGGQTPCATGTHGRGQASHPVKTTHENYPKENGGK